MAPNPTAPSLDYVRVFIIENLTRRRLSYDWIARAISSTPMNISNKAKKDDKVGAHMAAKGLEYTTMRELMATNKQLFPKPANGRKMGAVAPAEFREAIRAIEQEAINGQAVPLSRGLFASRLGKGKRSALDRLLRQDAELKGEFIDAQIRIGKLIPHEEKKPHAWLVAAGEISSQRLAAYIDSSQTWLGKDDMATDLSVSRRTINRRFKLDEKRRSDPGYDCNTNPTLSDRFEKNNTQFPAPKWKARRKLLANPRGISEGITALVKRAVAGEEIKPSMERLQPLAGAKSATPIARWFANDPVLMKEMKFGKRLCSELIRVRRLKPFPKNKFAERILCEIALLEKPIGMKPFARNVMKMRQKPVADFLKKKQNRRIASLLLLKREILDAPTISEKFEPMAAKIRAALETWQGGKLDKKSLAKASGVWEEHIRVCLQLYPMLNELYSMKQGTFNAGPLARPKPLQPLEPRRFLTKGGKRMAGALAPIQPSPAIGTGQAAVQARRKA